LPDFLVIVKELLITIAVVILAACNASAQNRISASAAAKAEIAMRIMQNAAEAELIDREFDPFTGGLMNGLQKNLEEEMETGSEGDRHLALMLYENWLWIVHYRIDHYSEPLRTEIMQWHFDCAHEINVALRRGVVPKHGGACVFTEAKFKKLNPE
jgi:hypothetical protein